MKGLLDIFEDFDVKPTLDQLINVSTLILPRLYTIASSNRKNPNSIHLCVSTERDLLEGGKIKWGLTSAYLTQKHQTSKYGTARINVRESTFILPTDAAIPVLNIFKMYINNYYR